MRQLEVGHILDDDLEAHTLTARQLGAKIKCLFRLPDKRRRRGGGVEGGEKGSLRRTWRRRPARASRCTHHFPHLGANYRLISPLHSISQVVISLRADDDDKCKGEILTRLSTHFRSQILRADARVCVRTARGQAVALTTCGPIHFSNCGPLQRGESGPRASIFLH